MWDCIRQVRFVRQRGYHRRPTHHRRSDTTAADGYFAQARQLTEAIPSAPERDRALAILATNEALALRVTDARQKLPKITDTQLRLALASDLSGLDQMAATVGP